jgi:hypothetical protein
MYQALAEEPQSEPESPLVVEDGVWIDLPFVTKDNIQKVKLEQFVLNCFQTYQKDSNHDCITSDEAQSYIFNSM